MAVVHVSNDHVRDRNAKLAARERRMNERLAKKHVQRQRIARQKPDPAKPAQGGHHAR